MTEPTDDSVVAIVGMSGRFPGAVDVDELWHNLIAGVGGLRPLTGAELAAVDPAVRADPAYVPVAGPVDGLDQFDAAAFGFTAREVETMEPHHRLLLECSWEALERAGYPPTDPGVPVGLFAGCAFPDYLVENVPHLGAEPGGKQYLAAGVERDSLTSLVSYKLGLRGPSLTVQTYCSTSLVAVHLACQSLLTYECDMALAGGAHLPLAQSAGYRYEDGGIVSPDGRVRSLDADANGTVMGSGVAVVALKRLSDAIADGDLVHAVILGSAVNNDGRERAGYTAPGVGGQAAVIETALSVAGVKPESVGYVECHAVGTPLGDSIELAALGRVFGTPRPSRCVLSSVKPSIGHLDRAAGVTGLVRAALSLRHAVLPGTAGFRTPNPALAAATDRFEVLPADLPWPEGPDPRRAGVSSFGLGGTNAHVVLEEAPPRPVVERRPGPHLLTFSAGDEVALSALTVRLREHLATHPDDDLADVAYTLQVSRGRFALRRAVVCRDREDALAALADPDRYLDGETRRRDPWVHLVPGAAVPDGWWSVLAEAVRDLLDAEGATGSAVVAMLASGLERLGVRVRAADPSPSDERIVVEPDGGTAAEWLLATIARLWQAGCAVEWATLHRGNGRRVELPTYPFQRRRYWLDARVASESLPVDEAGRTFLPSWRQAPRPLPDLELELRLAGPWLVFAADKVAEELAERLTYAGAEVVTVRPGDAYAVHETGDVTVRPADPEDLAALPRTLVATPRTVVHAFSLASDPGHGVAHLDAERVWGHDSVSVLADALADAGLPPVDLVLLTSGAVGVLGADLAHPEHAAVAALAPTLVGRPGIRNCRHVDVESGADVDQVLAALVGPYDGPLALRGDQTWLLRHEPRPLADPEPGQPAVLAGDTVLITEGLDGDGLAVARHLAHSYGCRLVLTTSAPVPPRELWTDRDDRLARYLRDVRDLESCGAAVAVVPTIAIDSVEGLDLVVHTGDTDALDAVRSFHTVQEALGDRALLRRVALCGPGTDTVLEAYARVARLAGQGRWIVASVDHGLFPGHLIDRVLAAAGHVTHVVVSTGSTAPTPMARPEQADTPNRRPRPALATPYVEPEAGLERTIADLWAAGLGIAEIGTDDNFFELGGRSAAAVQIAGQLRDRFSAALSLTEVVEYPTVRLLAARLTDLLS